MRVPWLAHLLRAVGTQTAIIDGFVGAVWALDGGPLAVFDFRVAQGKIVSIDIVGDPKRVRDLEVEVLS